MTPDRWGELEALFAAALEQPLDQRVSFVTARVRDADSLGDVLALLRAHDARGRLDSIADGLRRPRRADTIPIAELVGRLGAGVAARYRIGRELGRGGMAIVLLARDLKHGRDVALKVLHPDLALTIGPARFLREIAIAARLTHPHILPLHDSGEAAGFLYYVMPYVEGESLRDRLQRDTRLPVEEAVQIARQVAGALHYAHNHDVVHRDIKPENILLAAGQAVVSDFGIARAMTAAGGDEMSETGIVLGTPAYMSPEQAVGAHDVDGRTDIYSLACVLYETLAGTPPFTEPTVEGVLHQHLSTSPPSVRDVRPDVPEAVDDAIRRALAKAPAGRYLNASAFADALPQPGATALAGPKRVLAWASAAIVVAALGTATMLAGHRSAADSAAPVVAVLPLVPTVPDSALARLGRDLVVTVSANLDGVRRIRTVDALTVLAQTRRSGPLALQPGIQLASLLGAAEVVHGAIAWEGQQVRIDLGLFRTDNGQPIGRASVTADPRNLASLTDSGVPRGGARAAGEPLAGRRAGVRAGDRRGLDLLARILAVCLRPRVVSQPGRHGDHRRHQGPQERAAGARPARLRVVADRHDRASPRPRPRGVEPLPGLLAGLDGVRRLVISRGPGLRSRPDRGAGGAGAHGRVEP